MTRSEAQFPVSGQFVHLEAGLSQRLPHCRRREQPQPVDLVVAAVQLADLAERG